MQASDIVKQLWLVMPTLTDLFTDDLDVVSITSSGTTATVTTSSPHGLSTGEVARIFGALTPNPITSLTQVDNVASAVTSLPHNLTEGFAGTRIDPLTIEGATESEYNGSHPLLTQVDRNNFTYQISGDPSSPATGSPILLEDLKFGYNGLFNITETSTTTFTYTIPQPLGSPAGGTIFCRVRPRMSAVISQQRAIEAYTKQQTDKLWCFVVLGERVANNDRATLTDAKTTIGNGTTYRQLLIHPFAIYLFIPTVNELAANNARDQGNSLATFFSSSLLRIKLQTGFVEDPYSGIIFSSDNFALYNGSFYIHEYIFEGTEYITYDDTNTPDFGVAFRDIDLSFLSDFNDKEIMTAKVNLDDSA